MILAATVVQFLAIYLPIYIFLLVLCTAPSLISGSVYTPLSSSMETVVPALPAVLWAGHPPENVALSNEEDVAWVRVEGLVPLADSSALFPTRLGGMSW